MAYTFSANTKEFTSSILPLEFNLKNGDLAKYEI
jgi:hypothetical protein